MWFGNSHSFLIEILHSPLLPLFIIWEGTWKGIGMWKAARHNQTAWYVMILVLNTVGILPIVYILFFQKDKNKHKK
jgi:Family of unknown function (DUF5652)